MGFAWAARPLAGGLPLVVRILEPPNESITLLRGCALSHLVASWHIGRPSLLGSIRPQAACLTRHSSGPAFSRPLSGNVRRHFIPLDTHTMKRSRSLLYAVLLAGCSTTAPLSFLSGMPATRTDFHLYPVRIVSIDGDLQFGGPASQLAVAPGTHWVVLEAAPNQSARGSTQKSFAFKVEPCTRYILAAKREGAMQADWSLVVDRRGTVAGCDPLEERRKAEAAQPPTNTPSAPSR